MIKNICAVTTAIAASVLLAGCQFSNKTSVLMPTAPSATSPSGGSSSTGSSSSPAAATTTASPAAAGTWSSPTIAGLPNISTCANLQWQIASQSATSVAGTVSAVCGGVVNVSANLSGTLSGSDLVNLEANGQAVGLGITCPFSLVGIGHMQGSDAMKLDYQGTTCLGPVSGSQMLQRRAPAAPAPAPPAPPAPEPQPQPEPQPIPDDGAYGCSGIGDHMRLVECVHGHVNPHNEFEAFEVTKRVAWALRGEGVGLLIKTSGENIVPWKGYIFAAGRICYPDGHIIKIISDVGPGGANGPIWLDNGYVDSKLYLPALDPTN
jgi:hypothetical protein